MRVGRATCPSISHELSKLPGLEGLTGPRPMLMNQLLSWVNVEGYAKRDTREEESKRKEQCQGRNPSRVRAHLHDVNAPHRPAKNTLRSTYKIDQIDIDTCLHSLFPLPLRPDRRHHRL